jgi:serine/threonine protein kinase/Flp pilus assembly protein TadD
MIGKTISHYKILEKLGAGGMGVVYKAEDTKLMRTVALKFLPPELTRDDEAKGRFIHEAQAASALEHNNICNIHEIDQTEDGQTFITMACYEGETLKDKIDRGPLKIEDATNIAIQIAQGLAKAHEKDIVHRDVKPSNIFITTDGIVKIIDFGLAKLAGRTVLTKEGTTFGTVNYMSPEQTRGEAVDHRTDIWSLGILFYEMLTGQRPFKGDYEQAVLYSILNNDPEPISGLRTGIPLELEIVVNRCLQKESSARYQDVNGLLIDLRQREKSTGKVRISDIALSPSKKAWLIRATLAFLVVMLILYFSGMFHSDVQNASAKKTMLAVLPFENLGSIEDEYFSDGLTVEMTAKLGRLQQLRVISDRSAYKYKNSDKSDSQIGTELGVDFVMRSTIMWQRAPNEPSRVRVIPRLIRTIDGEQIWTAAYTATMTDVFEVQADITEKVVGALGIALLELESESLTERPTTIADAYDFYLRGLSYANRPLRRFEDEQLAIEMFEKAIELDSNYVEAYSSLSASYSNFFADFGHKEAGPKAKSAAEKAIQLAPKHPKSHWALGSYYFWVNDELELAEKHYAIAHSSLPNSAILLSEMGMVQIEKGKWNQAVLSLKEAVNLDPKSYAPTFRLGRAYYHMRRYNEAEQQLNRCIALFPDSPWPNFWQVLLYLTWEGDTKRTRKALQNASEHTDLMRFLLVNWDFDDSMVLRIFADHFAPELKRLTIRDPADSAAYYLEKGEASLRVGEDNIARSFYDSARVVLEARFPARDGDGQAFYRSRQFYGLGVVYARLGRKKDAIRMGEQAVKVYPLEKYSYAASYPIPVLAEIYTLTGEYEAAIDQLEIALSVPSILSVPLIKLDPIWDPLRKHPSYKRLLGEMQ